MQTEAGMTYAFVDLPDDRWAWAIVTDFEDAQTYGLVVCAFHEGFEPDDAAVALLLHALANRVCAVCGHVSAGHTCCPPTETP